MIICPKGMLYQENKRYIFITLRIHHIMKSSCFKIVCRDEKTDARVGILSTKKKKVKTPFFMPVATKASVKQISSSDLKEMNCPAIISNALILHLRPGEKLIKRLGGLGKFMNFDGINVTDSGGFQMYSSSLYVGSDEKGVYFKDPFENKTIMLTPERDMQIQLDLNAEIAMCLDTMPLLEHSRNQIALAVNRTTSWAKRCKEEHARLQKGVKKNRRQLLWGITQGGVYDELREKSARELKKLDFDGYSVGGLALGETIKQEMKMIKIHKKIIGENKPCYLMGAGNPPEILDAISLGVDFFDSRFPTKCARHGLIFTHSGKLRILRKRYIADNRPLDEDCGCSVCKNYSRAYIRYQLKQGESVGMRLASYHNLYYLQELMRDSQEAIMKGKFKEFKSKVQKIYSDEDRRVKRKN
jgi:queuine tRNA-ribosyltransferase